MCHILCRKSVCIYSKGREGEELYREGGREGGREGEGAGHQRRDGKNT